MGYDKTIDVLDKTESIGDKMHCVITKSNIQFPKEYSDACLDARLIEHNCGGKGTLDLYISLNQDGKIVDGERHYTDNGLKAKAKASSKYEELKKLFINKHTKNLNKKGIGVNIIRDTRFIELSTQDLFDGLCDHIKDLVSKLDKK